MGTRQVRTFLALIGFCLLSPGALAAQGPWTTSLVVQPFPSPFVADWERNPQLAVLTLLYSGPSPQDFHVEGYVRSSTRGELARVRSPDFFFAAGPVSQLFNAADILDWATISKNQQYVDLVLRSGVLPEGPLEMCTDVLDAADVRLAGTCTPFSIALPDPPQLIFPASGAVVAGLQPVFQWTPVRVPVEIGVTYRVRIFETLEGQTPSEAVAANPPWLESDVEGAPLLVYPVDALPLEDQKRYAWQVEALDADRNPLTRGGRASEIWTFQPGGPGRPPPDIAGVLPDVIDLIPGVARLTGLKNATVEDGPVSYLLNGNVTLEVLAPAAFEARVEATDLEIDKLSLQTVPQIRGGTLAGSLDPAAVPTTLSGHYVRLDHIEYAPASGLTLAGRLALPGATPVALTGKVQVTAAGLFGTLRAAGAGGTPILTLGADPARLLIQSAEVSLPGEVTVQGGLELFAKDVDCRGVSASFDAAGALSAQVSCTPHNPVPLVAAGDRARFDLLTLSGSLTTNPSTGAVTYDLAAAAQLKLDAGGSNCGASLEIRVKNDGVTVPSFTPRCDPNEGSSNIGWLQTKLTSLQLTQLTYAAGAGFTFALSVDLAPWVPAIPGFTLPALTAVTITQDGLAIPALDVTINRPPITVAGFGLQVKRVILPAFTLSWKDWQAHSAAGFKFGFDADFTMPNLPGEAACLTAQPISITGAELSNGRLKAKLAERRFTPACGITLQKDVHLASSDVGLTQVAAADATATPSSSPGGDISGVGAGGIFGRWLAQAAVKETGSNISACDELERGKYPSENPAQVFAFDPCNDPTEPDAWEGIKEYPPAPLVQAFDGKDGLKAFYDLEMGKRAKEDKEEADAYDDLQNAIDHPDCDPKTVECQKKLADKKAEFDKLRERIKTRRETDPAAKPLNEMKNSIMECLGIERQKQLLGVTSENDPGTAQACQLAEAVESYRNGTVLPNLRPPWYDHITGKPDPANPPAPSTVRRWCDLTMPDAAIEYLSNERTMQMLGVNSAGGSGDLLGAAQLCAKRANLDLKSACLNHESKFRLDLEAQKAFAAERNFALLGVVADDDDSFMQAKTACYSNRINQTTTAVSGTGGGGSGGGGVEGVNDAGNPAGGPFVSDSAPVWMVAGSPAAAARRAAGDDVSLAVRLELDRVGGDFAIAFFPYFIVDAVPEIEGKIVLPGIFQCVDANQQKASLSSTLRLGPRGELNGTVFGFVPACPINLASVEVTVTKSELTFSTMPNEQVLVMSAAVSAKFTAASQPISADGQITVDLVHGRMIDGSLAFKGPFTLGLPKDKPVLAFTVQSAVLDTLGIHFDGRGELNLGPGQTIGTTFDHVTINPQTVSLTGGQILFDASFGFEVGIGADGQLAWGARPRGAPLSIQSGLRVDLPSQIALGTNGFSASGDGGARLVYEGKDVDGLSAKFSADFALSLGPPGVRQGAVDFQRNGVSLAYVDASGFHPNLAYFASAVLPARLPLPSVDVAYLELRDAAGNLRVSTENTGDGVRLFTAPGVTVPLYVPALQVGRPAAPRLDVALDLTIDPLKEGISLGGISATVPVANQNSFDLSANGIPFAIQEITYARSAGGGYQWTLAGLLKLFNRTQGTGAADRVMLTLDGTGRLAGSVNLSPQQAIPIVEGSQKMTLTLQSIAGSFDADLPHGDLRFNLGVTAGLDLALSTDQSYHAAATLTVSDQGVHADNITYGSSGGSDDYKYLDLSAVKLGLKHLRVPELDYSQATGFRFRLLFDAAIRFPSLQNLTLPPINDIELRNDGFTIPAFEAPSLHLATASAAGDNATMTSDGPLALGGFALDVEAFRMNAIHFNWFTGQGPSDWGFGLDLSLGLGNLLADAPQSLKDMRVHVVNAGFSNGRFTGSVERFAFPTPVPLGFGELVAISGSLPTAGTGGTGAAPFSLQAELNLNLASVLPVCSGNTSLTKSNAVLSIYGDGWVSGTIDQVIPNCPNQAGPFRFQFGQSRVVFGAGNDAGGARTRSLELEVAATVSFPGITEGSTVTASGNVHFDLLQRRWIDGRIDVDQPFRYSPPDNNPYFAFEVSHASLDATGLHFNGSGSLRAADDAKIGIQFNNFTIGLPDFRVTTGSVTFTNQFALGVGINQGELQWGVFSPTAPRPPGSSFRFVAPQSVTLDGNGLTLNGTATASLQFSDKTYASLDVTFLDNFRVGFNPVAVSAGRANFVLNNEEIAHVDATGFWPGNVFGIIPLPARLGLPGEDVAYLEVRDPTTNALLIETQTSPTGLQLRTKPNQSVRLVVPALAAQGGGAPPAVNVAFDVVVNPANFQFVSGFVRAESDAQSPALLSLEGLGYPLTVRRLAFEKIGNAYGLRLAARFKLPESLNGLDVDVPNLVVTPQGLSGEIQMGSYLPDYVAGTSIISKSFLSDTLVLAVTGARLKFGPGAEFGLKGRFSSRIFKADNEPPAELKWSGGVSAAGQVTLQMDDAQGAKLPLAVAEFSPTAIGTEPALLITASSQDFKVRLSGVLKIPSISDGFALSIAGLEVGNHGVVFPTISISGLDPTQELDVFGAKLALKDSTDGTRQVFPALKVGVTQGVVSVELSGRITFMENTATFYGLRVATNGQFSLAQAELLSKPIEIVEGVLTVDKLTVVNNSLRTDLSIILPEPLNAPGPQKVNFTISPNGTITGGADITLINQPAGLTQAAGTPGPDTHFDVGIATIHLRYLGIKLDFAHLKEQSEVKIVTDFYIQNKADNLVKVGDVIGGVVKPGLTIGFNGNVAWGNLALDHEFNFDFEAVKLKIRQVTADSRPNGGFAIGVSGALGLNVSVVTGELKFQGFAITSKGEVEFSPSGIQGGELAIADVIKVSLHDIGFSASPTTITIKGGGLPSAGQNLSEPTDPDSKDQTVAVSSFISFGGSLSVMDIFSGSVQRFLFYRGTDQTTHLLIQQASLKIMDIVNVTGDFKYDETLNGFDMLMGAQGKIMSSFDIVLVGAFGREGTKSRAGMFVAVKGLQIQIGPYVTIRGLGGGFFLNPRPEWLEYVRLKAGVSQTAGRYIAAPEASFTILLYGEAGIIRPELIMGQILITVGDTFFRLDGKITILMQAKFYGDFHVQIGFKDVDIQGNVGFTLDYAPVVEAKGYLDIFIKGENNWGVMGKASAHVMAMLEGGAEIMISPAGFYFDGKITMGLNVWVIQLDGFMEAKVWFISANQSWGAYLEMGVKASVLGGLASATGTLRGAIMFGGTPFVFAAASLAVQCPVGKWEGWVWAKIQEQHLTAGFGEDPAMMAAIAEAQRVSGDLTAAKDEAQKDLGTSGNVVPATVALTEQELIAAYNRIQGWTRADVLLMGFVLGSNEFQAQKYLTAADKAIEDPYVAWYYDVLNHVGLPGDTTAIAEYTRQVNQGFTSLQNDRPQVEARIAALRLSIQQLTPMGPGTDAALANPIRSVTLPTYREVPADTGRGTKRVYDTAPSFDLDAGAAAARVSMLEGIRTQAEANDLKVREQIAALETGLASLRAATTTSDPAALPSLVGQYANIGTLAERQFAAQADLILGRQDWVRARLAELGAKDATATQWIQRKTSSLNTGAVADYSLLKTVTSIRMQTLSGTSGNPSVLTNFNSAVTTTEQLKTSSGGADWASRWAFMTAQSNTSGRQLWFDLANTGLQNANTQADAAFAGLQAQADTRLRAIRDVHGALTRSLNGLYEVQTDATGALYDLYDRYYFWRTGTNAPPVTTASSGSTVVVPPGGRIALLSQSTVPAPPPTVTDLQDISVLRSRHDRLAEDLTVPTINDVRVTAVNSGRYSAQLQFSWSAWHPSGTYEYQFRESDGPNSGVFYSNGGRGALTSYRFTPNRTTASAVTRTLEVGVRGGAGFTGYGRTSYTLNFQQGPNTPAGVTGGGLQADNTPPSVPVVSFLDRSMQAGANGQPEVWTNSSERVTAQWSADDPESGIGEFQYALWGTPNGATVIRPFTSAGGRTWVDIDRLDLASGRPVYVAVRAKNGQGAFSAAGVSAVLRYDPTPPAFVAGTAITLPQAYIAAPGAGQSYAACPVSVPPYPSATPPSGLPFLVTMIAWNGGLGGAPAGVRPEVRFGLPPAIDAESGLEDYEYRITTTPPDPTYGGEGWTRVSGKSPSVVASGDPLDYEHQFYIAIAPRNRAGSVGQPLTYGPFSVTDPTPPTFPEICASYAGGTSISVQMKTEAVDDESQILGYQFQVRTSAKGGVVRAWPAGQQVDWQPGATYNYVSVKFEDGQTYYVDVRALNKKGVRSAVASSGPILYDATPPPTPTASVSQVLLTQLSVSINAPADPHSALSLVQYAVGSTATSSDLLAWRSQPVAPGTTTLTLSVPSINIGATYYLRVRTVNGVQQPSAVYTASYTVPMPAVPRFR